MSGEAVAGDHSAFRPLYHRKESPTQTPADAMLQVSSMEIWGRPARGSHIPSVKAYRGILPSSGRGVEFTTLVSPTPGSGTPFEARWYENTRGVMRKHSDFVAIPASTVINRQP
jgi:hypothetical protein